MGNAAMTNRMEALEDWAAGLLGQLEPASREKLTRGLGQMLRRSQQRRIIAQRNTDGSKYAPRKQRNLRGKQGRVRRKVRMFRKLRTTKFLKARSDVNAISVGFTRRASRIAKVHHYGLKDCAERGAPAVVYEQRKVLGFTEADLDLIRDGLLAHLNLQSQ